MLKKLFCIIFLLSFLFTEAQHITLIDSLSALLKKAKDTSIVNLYNLISWEYRNSDIAKTDSFANLAIELAVKENFHKGLGNAYISKGFVSKNSGDYTSAIQTYQSALVQFVKAGYKPGFWTVYNNIATAYY